MYFLVTSNINKFKSFFDIKYSFSYNLHFYLKHKKTHETISFVERISNLAKKLNFTFTAFQKFKALESIEILQRVIIFLGILFKESGFLIFYFKNCNQKRFMMI